MSKDKETTGKPVSSRGGSISGITHRLPYGEQQGSFMGVVTCSNRDDGFFSGESNYLSGGLIYTGYRYQCVEYARRFLLLTTGCQFGSCRRACEIFNMKHLTNVESGKEYPFVSFENGRTTQRPQPGDIIVYPFHAELVPWGHVGVISYVDDEKVAIAEQNYFFGPFFSPDPNYLDGERCASRFVDLLKTEDGCWRLREREATMLDCLGWMTYPTAPRREQIFAPLSPLSDQVSVRSTPIEADTHPCVYHITLPEPAEILTGEVKSLYGLKNGTGESFLASLAAVSRIIRLTMQLLFNRVERNGGFLRLPYNPLGAKCPVTGVNAAVDKLMHTFCEVLDCEDRSRHLHEALASYFDIPVECIEAMEREFSKADCHLLATHTFTLDLGKDIPCHDDGGFCIHVMKSGNPHDEAWHLSKVDFKNPIICSEMDHLTQIKERFEFPLNFIDGSYRAHFPTKFRMDFGGYLRTVEALRGPRNAFVIVRKPEMDGTELEMVRIFQDYCEHFRYPVTLIDEKDLFFDPESGKLLGKQESTSADTESTVSNFEINFTYVLEEWHTILHQKERHGALYSAATHPDSDVVFAKPLWSWLCTGLVNSTDVNTGGSTVSTKFFDISRRLYELSIPKQPADTWDMEICEYKDSCRRVHLLDHVKYNPPCGFVARGVVVDNAYSCFTGGETNSLTLDKDSTEFQPIRPASMGYLFSS